MNGKGVGQEIKVLKPHGIMIKDVYKNDRVQAMKCVSFRNAVHTNVEKILKGFCQKCNK